MGNKNYTKYSEKSESTVEEIIDTVVDTVVDDVVDTVVDDVVDTVVDDVVDTVVDDVVDTVVDDVVDTVVDDVVDTVVDDVVDPIDTIKNGIVTGCIKLNVRKEPSKDAEIVCVLEEFHEVTLDTTSPETYEDFYKIYTSVNDVLIEGYCMKKFINIK